MLLAYQAHAVPALWLIPRSCAPYMAAQRAAYPEQTHPQRASVARFAGLVLGEGGRLPRAYATGLSSYARFAGFMFGAL